MKKLDKKDYLLLDILQEGSKNALSKAAKELRLHKNSVLYRITRLRRLGIIRNFSFIPGITAMGKNTFYVFFRLRLGTDVKEKAYTYLKNHPLALEVLRLSGRWNLYVELICDDINHFNDELTKMTGYLGDAVIDYKTVLLYRPYKVESAISFEKEYSGRPFRPSGKVHLDELEKRILSRLSDESNLSYGEIAGKIGSTSDIVFNRIKKMKANGVIRKFVPVIDIEKAGYQRYLVLLKFSAVSIDKFQSFAGYITSNRNVNFAFRTAGELGVVFFCALKANDELDLLLSDIEERFGQAIRQMDILIVNERLKFDYFPEGLIK